MLGRPALSTKAESSGTLSVSLGAIKDIPDLVVACVMGDGEAETGPTATAWRALLTSASCAAALGKKNFFIPGEVTGGNTFGSLYIRGRTPTQLPPGYEAVPNVTASDSQYFLRDAPLSALDAVAFHYSTYRAMTCFLGMDGNLQAAYDVDINFITAWHEIFVDNDFLNSQTGELDPRHMYGTSNFDVFRWPSLQNGTQMSVLGTFISSLPSSNKASGNVTHTTPKCATIGSPARKPLDLLAQSIHLECARVRLCRASVPGSATPPKAPAVQDAQPNAAVKLQVIR
ncbi:hypothetical protein B0H10DRAFT_2231221 [Mycena sp. CBHHK59/15]|nr:hypothetical protein B0H10DRAFT_2231221 [Mycena sp. CBHHK59/15]